MGHRSPLTTLRDGTIKQVNPFTGTQVWTVPGRANRPLGLPPADKHKIDHTRTGRHCAFCQLRYADTPPEKARLVRSGESWQVLTGLMADELEDTVAEFRLIPNLFEILSFDYWRLNYGYQPSAQAAAYYRAYVSTERGRAHVLDVARSKAGAAGMTQEQWDALGTAAQLEQVAAFFGGCHDVVVARRHFTDGGKHEDDLAGSGTLTPTEHARYVGFTAAAVRMQYDGNPHARYLQAFQNWLRPAGASFDHLHKQVVAIDELGVDIERQLLRVREDPDLYARLGVGYAADRGLLIAENDHAVAVAGIGHRFPSVVVYARGQEQLPWLMGRAELDGFADVLHTVHAAVGARVPVNEQWYHRPPSVETAMPFRAVVSLRISTLAGFEGGTKIYLNTIDPLTLRNRLVDRLQMLRPLGEVVDLAIGDECRSDASALRYTQV